MLESTIQLPQQHPTTTSHARTIARTSTSRNTFTLEHHTHDARVVPKPNSMPKPFDHHHQSCQPPPAAHPNTGHTTSTTNTTSDRNHDHQPTNRQVNALLDVPPTSHRHTTTTTAAATNTHATKKYHEISTISLERR